MLKTGEKAIRRLWLPPICLLSVLLALILMAAPVQASDVAQYALCDVRVLYVFDEKERVDWPVLYYLNDQFGCRIDLLTFGPGRDFRHTTKEVPDREIYLHTCYVDTDDSTALDSLAAVMFAVRRPDIVIVGDAGHSKQYQGLIDYLVELPPDSRSIFNILKIYRLSDGTAHKYNTTSSVTLNHHELFARYRERIELEVPILIRASRAGEDRGVQLIRYDLIRKDLAGNAPEADFLSGIRTTRLVPVIDSVLTDGALRQAFARRAENFLSLFGSAPNSVGQERVKRLMNGYKELVTLKLQVISESNLAGIGDFLPYLERLMYRAQRAVLQGIGMNWTGRIVLRDSPHGPKLKFRASLSVNGPQAVGLSHIRFQPYWDTVDVVLDAVPRMIQPHQTFVQEYLVDIEQSRLEARMPESLVFTAEIVYGHFPLPVTSTLPIWEIPDLDITIHPGFCFIQPFARLNVDRVVSSMNWKVVITKPRYFYGTVKLNLETPRGVFAGVYRKELALEKGRTRETVRIPFSVSNLFEMGIQRQTVSLSVDNRVVAADTGLIRIASCHIADTIKVGFLPDTTGLLEDILRMTDAAFQPLTDRALLTGDLDAYNVILIGSGALREYPSFRDVRGRIEDFIRWGGSLVVFGQPSNWPEGVLPVALVPAQEMVNRTELLNRIPKARILSTPHVISEDKLLSAFDMRRQVSAAVVSPAEQVYVTPTGAALLSVSRLGDGQVIYCGLPLTEMISRLNLEAIHLFANILNY